MYLYMWVIHYVAAQIIVMKVMHFREIDEYEAFCIAAYLYVTENIWRICIHLSSSHMNARHSESRSIICMYFDNVMHAYCLTEL